MNPHPLRLYLLSLSSLNSPLPSCSPAHRIITSYRTFFLYAGSAQEAEDWIKILQWKLVSYLHPSPITLHSSPLTLIHHQSLLTTHPSPITSHPSLLTTHSSPVTPHYSLVTIHPLHLILYPSYHQLIALKGSL